MVTARLNECAIDWSDDRPRLVRYHGRLEGERPGEEEALISYGQMRAIVPHATVFWFGAMGMGEVPFHRLSIYFGNA